LRQATSSAVVQSNQYDPCASRLGWKNSISVGSVYEACQSAVRARMTSRLAA
jgi:hypothetical protein